MSPTRFTQPREHGGETRRDEETWRVTARICTRRTATGSVVPNSIPRRVFSSRIISRGSPGYLHSRARLSRESSFAARHSLAMQRFYSSVYQIQATNKIHARGQRRLRTHLVFVSRCHMHGKTANLTRPPDGRPCSLSTELKFNQRTTTDSAIKETFSFVRTDVSSSSSRPFDGGS